MEQKFILGAVVILIAGAIGLFVFMPQKAAAPTTEIPAGKYTDLAECIAKSGAKFYGAFWCPHCKAQKELFGDAAEKLPYVECSTPDGKEVNQICKDAGVEGYPTWVFANGTRATGEVPLASLASSTSCTLPTP